MYDIYNNIEEYTPNKSIKILIVFDNTADMVSTKKLNPIVITISIRNRKLNTSPVFIYNLILMHQKILN